MAIKRASFDITIYRGDTHEEVYQLFRDKDLNKPITLQGTTLKGQARIGPNDVLWFEIPIEIINDEDGIFRIYLSPEQTTELGAAGETHQGRFDIQASRAGRVFTFATGSVVITDDYTYEN